MEIPFVKMNGAGNDFVMIDNRDKGLDLPSAVIQGLCDRKRGVGADGVILIESPADGARSDFRMRYYNADGGEVEMCGNGARCAARFASELGLGRPENGGLHLDFTTQPGPMQAEVAEMDVAISMTDAVGLEKSVSLDVAQGTEIVHLINTGVPHAVVLVDDAGKMSDEEVVARGRAIRRHARFEPDGANANFISINAQGVVVIRTYERGVEDETLACGTGSVAAAVIAAQLGHAQSPVTLLTHGGENLDVRFSPNDTGASRVILQGPADRNFAGIVTIDLED